jgi:transposase
MWNWMVEEKDMSSSSSLCPEVAAWVGIDWADQEPVISLRVAGSPTVELLGLQQQPETLQNWVRQLRQRFTGRPVAMALEQSRGPLWYALLHTDFLLLYPINPKSLAKYREAFYPSGAKDDPVDATLLRELLEKNSPRLRCWKPEDPLTRQLQLAVEYRRHLVEERTALTNQVTNRLKNYFPEALSWAGGLDTVQACDFLQRWPSLAAIQKASPGKIRKFYQLHNCRHPQLIEERLEQIRSAPPLTRDPGIIGALSLMVRCLVKPIQSLLESITEFDQQIQALFAQHPDPDLFDSFPGAGPAMGPRLLAAFGSDRDRFEDSAAVKKFSGMAPITRKSGRSRVVLCRYACPKFQRQTFHEWAGLTVRFCSWAAEFYQRKKAAGMKHHALLRELASQWIDILTRCWKDHRLYDENLYLDNRKKRHAPRIRKHLPLVDAL